MKTLRVLTLFLALTAFASASAKIFNFPMTNVTIEKADGDVIEEELPVTVRFVVNGSNMTVKLGDKQVFTMKSVQWVPYYGGVLEATSNSDDEDEDGDSVSDMKVVINLHTYEITFADNAAETTLTKPETKNKFKTPFKKLYEYLRLEGKVYKDYDTMFSDRIEYKNNPEFNKYQY